MPWKVFGFKPGVYDVFFYYCVNYIIVSRSRTAMEALLLAACLIWLIFALVYYLYSGDLASTFCILRALSRASYRCLWFIFIKFVFYLFIMSRKVSGSSIFIFSVSGSDELLESENEFAREPLSPCSLWLLRESAFLSLYLSAFSSFSFAWFIFAMCFGTLDFDLVTRVRFHIHTMQRAISGITIIIRAAT